MWQLICATSSGFQEGEDLDDLLAEINEELPSEEEDEDIDPTLTNVQRRVRGHSKIRNILEGVDIVSHRLYLHFQTQFFVSNS